MSREGMEREANLLAEEAYDAGDKQAVNKQRKKAARIEREKLDFTKAIMSTPEGRKWMYDLISYCNPLGEPTIPGDIQLTYRNIGRQDIGKKLFIDIEMAAPEEYTQMMKESRQKS